MNSTMRLLRAAPGPDLPAAFSTVVADRLGANDQRARDVATQRAQAADARAAEQAAVASNNALAAEQRARGAVAQGSPALRTVQVPTESRGVLWWLGMGVALEHPQRRPSTDSCTTRTEMPSANIDGAPV